MAPLGAQGADLAVQVLGVRGYPRIPNLAHLFRSRLLLQPNAPFIWRFDAEFSLQSYRGKAARGARQGRMASVRAASRLPMYPGVVRKPSVWLELIPRP